MLRSIDTHLARSVLTVTLSRPDRRNALNQEMVRELTTALETAHSDEGVRVIVVTGAGTAFSAGADLESLKALRNASHEDNERDSQLLAALFRTIYAHPKPIVARVNGHAIAGGCGLVAASDFAVAADTAKLGFTEVRIGFVPAIVSTLLVRKLRGADIRRLLLTGELVDAEEAARIGLVTRVVPSEELDSAVEELARLLSRETSGVAVALTKEPLGEVDDLAFDAALEYATAMNVRARGTADCRAGIDAFLAKEQPPWRMREG